MEVRKRTNNTNVWKRPTNMGVWKKIINHGGWKQINNTRILFFSENYHHFNWGLICRKYTSHKVDVYGDRLFWKYFLGYKALWWRRVNAMVSEWSDLINAWQWSMGWWYACFAVRVKRRDLCMIMIYEWFTKCSCDGRWKIWGYDKVYKDMIPRRLLQAQRFLMHFCTCIRNLKHGENLHLHSLSLPQFVGFAWNAQSQVLKQSCHRTILIWLVLVSWNYMPLINHLLERLTSCALEVANPSMSLEVIFPWMVDF